MTKLTTIAVLIMACSMCLAGETNYYARMDLQTNGQTMYGPVAVQDLNPTTNSILVQVSAEECAARDWEAITSERFTNALEIAMQDGSDFSKWQPKAKASAKVTMDHVETIRAQILALFDSVAAVSNTLESAGYTRADLLPISAAEYKQEIRDNM